MDPTFVWQNLRNAFFSLVCAFLSLYALKQNDSNKRKLLVVLLVNILLGCVYTLYRIRSNPLLPRVLSMSAERVSAELDESVNTTGILMYDGIFGMALIFPSFLYWISQRQGLNKLLPVVIAMIFILTVFRAQFAIALIFMIAGIVLYLPIRFGSSKYLPVYYAIFAIVALVCLLYWDVILKAIFSANILPSELQRKVREMLLFSSGSNLNGTNLLSRSTYYAQSFKAIVENGFVGKVFVNHAAGGGHSEWEDMAANYGIIAPALVYFFFYKFTKKTCTYMENSAVRVYRIQLLLFLLIGFIDPIFHSRTMSYLMFLSPLILSVSYQSEGEK